MSARRYSPRRAGKRWLEGAPSYVLDVFYHPQFADCYTVWMTGNAHTFHTRRDGTIGQGPDQYANTYITGIGTSEAGGTSGSLEYGARDVAMYRYRNKHRRIRWADLPDVTKRLVMQWAESD